MTWTNRLTKQETIACALRGTLFIAQGILPWASCLWGFHDNRDNGDNLLRTIVEAVTAFGGKLLPFGIFPRTLRRETPCWCKKLRIGAQNFAPLCAKNCTSGEEKTKWETVRPEGAALHSPGQSGGAKRRHDTLGPPEQWTLPPRRGSYLNTGQRPGWRAVIGGSAVWFSGALPSKIGGQSNVAGLLAILCIPRVPWEKKRGGKGVARAGRSVLLLRS